MGKPKARGNGQGTAILSKNKKSWTAVVTIRSEIKDGKYRLIRKKKSGFPTKRAALEACALLAAQANAPKEKRARYTLKEVYAMWEAYYSPRVDESTMVCYSSAYKHFSEIHDIYIDLIEPENLQSCMDACPAGKRTHQNMKVTAGLIWAYAVDHKIIDRDITRNLFIGKLESKQRESLTDKEVDIFKQSIGKERYAEYVYCLCYLGFRPGELLELKKSALHSKEIDNKTVYYLVGGKKTQAGRNRMVIVPAQILDIVLSRLYVPGTDYLFPQYVFSRKKPYKFLMFKEMSDEFLRDAFKKIANKHGIKDTKVPYSARHTYADKLGKAEGSDKDKAKLIGHTDFKFTQDKYMSTDIAGLNAVVESIK